MKKISIFIICLLFITIMPSFAVTINAEVKYSVADSSFYVCGSFENETRGNIAVGLQILKNDVIVLADTATAALNGGKITFAFEKIPVFETMESGEYKFVISSFLGIATVYVDFLNVGEMLLVLKALENQNDGAYAQTLLTYGAAFGIDIAEYESLSSNSNRVFLEEMSKKSYGLKNVDKNTPNYVHLTKEAAIQFVEDYNEMIAVGFWNDCQSGSEIKSWIEKNAENFGLAKDSAETDYNEGEIFKLYQQGNFKTMVADKLLITEGLLTIDSIKEKFYELTLCCYLDQAHMSKANDILTTYDKAFGISLVEYNSLKNKEYVQKNIVGKQYFTYTDVRDAFNTLVQTAKENENVKSGSPGGGGGVPKNNSVSGGFEIGTAPVISDALPFDDLEFANWAIEPILYLHNKNIINGKENGKFDPNVDITRAEFIKIVIKALEIEQEGIPSFDDVTRDAWYYTYIGTAQKYGLINGNDRNMFMPNESISRQDLAVILYRALKVNAEIQTSQFTDYNQVADYAKKAVGYFSKIGVINGLPDGTFSPLENATRAQVAKIVYEVIK